MSQNKLFFSETSFVMATRKITDQSGCKGGEGRDNACPATLQETGGFLRLLFLQVTPQPKSSCWRQVFNTQCFGNTYNPNYSTMFVMFFYIFFFLVQVSLCRPELTDLCIYTSPMLGLKAKPPQCKTWLFGT